MTDCSPSVSVNVCSSKLAAGVVICNSQLPFSSAWVLTYLFAHEGVTTSVEFGVAFPQIRTLLFFCKTILSLSSGGNLTFASILMLHSTIIKK